MCNCVHMVGSSLNKLCSCTQYLSKVKKKKSSDVEAPSFLLSHPPPPQYIHLSVFYCHWLLFPAFLLPASRLLPYLCFCAWFPLLSITRVRLLHILHVVVLRSLLLLCSTPPTPWISITQFICLAVDGHWLVYSPSAAGKILVRCFCWNYIFFLK